MIAKMRWMSLMSNMLRHFAIILSFLTLVACGGGTSGTNITAIDTGTVEGTVKDSVTGNVISGVTIQIGTPAAVTGINGVYSITGLNIGSRTVSATRSGYQNFNDTVTVQKGVTVTHDIQLIPIVSSAKVTINLTGTLPAATTIVGADFTLTLPANVTPLLNNGTVDASVITPSGTFAGGTNLTPVYTHATVTSAGTLKVTLANASQPGITSVGEIATITLQLSNNVTPSAANFSIATGSTVFDRRGDVITGMSAGVASVVLN
jgi:hypothetical protein